MRRTVFFPIAHTLRTNMLTFLPAAMLCVLPLVAGSMPAKVTDKPSFCHGLDCPKFSVVETTDDFELRAYEAGVVTSAPACSYSSSKKNLDDRAQNSDCSCISLQRQSRCSILSSIVTA